MIVSLHIENFAIIDNADVDFDEGLSVIIGETGSGKTVILKAIDVCLGEKCGADLIKKGADSAFISVSFFIPEDLRKDFKDEFEQYADESLLNDGDLIITRKIDKKKSQFKVNGLPARALDVRSLSSFLLDMHGQKDTYIVLEDDHTDIIDSFGDDDFHDLLKKQGEEYIKFKSLKKELDEIGSDDKLREREIDLLKFEIDELKEADISKEEDEEIYKKNIKIRNFMDIVKGLSEVAHLLSDSPGNASDAISEAEREVSELLVKDESLSTILERLTDAEEAVSDAVKIAEDYISGGEIDEEEAEFIKERVNVYNHIKDKYGDDIDKVLKLLEEKEEKYDKLVNAGQFIENIKKSIEDTKKTMNELCEKLHNKRVKIAEILEGKISAEMKDLNFKDIRLKMDFKQREGFTAGGIDKADLLISLNPGEDLKPLKDAASGGEMSRIMLAIKAVLAEKDRTDTLIFDEIDTGISSKTAQCMAEKLYRLSRYHQVICITHLPQLAAMADHYFNVSKNVSENITKVEINKLNSDEEIPALARFLGGSKITDSVIKNAEEMKELADDFKRRKN